MSQEATNGSYVDYKYYTDTYGGKKIGAAEFPSVSRWATALVDQMTFGRILNLPSIPDCVKDAVCSAADRYYDYKVKASLEIKSESNDGYSVSYVDSGKEEDAIKGAKSDVRIYLANTGLLFRGRSRLYDNK